MARLPLPPRFSRMLLFANQQGLMVYAVLLVAALSVPELFATNAAPAANGRGSDDDDDAAADGKSGETAELTQFRATFVQQFVRRVGFIGGSSLIPLTVISADSLV